MKTIGKWLLATLIVYGSIAATWLLALLCEYAMQQLDKGTIVTIVALCIFAPVVVAIRYALD